MITVDINRVWYRVDVVPWLYWLHENNQLEKVVVSKGMRDVLLLL